MYAYLSCQSLCFPFHATLVTVFASCYHDNPTTVKRTKTGRSKSAPFSDYLGNLLFPSHLRFSLYYSSTGCKNCTNVVAKNFIFIKHFVYDRCYFYSQQHFIFSVSSLIDMLVPDIPGGLEETIKREAYQAKQIMSDHHGLMGEMPDSDDYMLELET